MKPSKKSHSNTISLKDFNLDKNRKIKLYRQLYESVVDLIESNSVENGTKLPSVRDLSQGLKISKNTVTKAYDDLQQAGYIYSLSKSGFYTKNPGDTVTDTVKSVPKTQDEEDIPTVDSIFKGFNGQIDADQVIRSKSFDSVVLKDSLSSSDNKEPDTILMNAPHRQNRKIMLSNGEVIENNMTQDNDAVSTTNIADSFMNSVRQALSQYRSSQKHLKHDISGIDEFKVAIASFIYKFFNIDINPSQVFVGTDINQLLDNILSLPSIKTPFPRKESRGLLKLAEEVAEGNIPVMRPVAAIKENPDKHIKNIFLRNNIDVRQIPTGNSGMIFNLLAESGANLAFTSSDDIPFGDLERLEEAPANILAWADEEEYRYIFELDKLSYIHARPLKQHDKNDKVIYFRSFGNFFNLTCACFVVLPKKLAEEYREEYKDFHCPLSHLEQLAFTDFIISGKLYNYLEKIEDL